MELRNGERAQLPRSAALRLTEFRLLIRSLERYHLGRAAMNAQDVKSSAKSAEARSLRQFLNQKLRCPSFLSLLLALATSTVFLQVVRNEFVNYDDPDYVSANTHVETGVTWKNVAWAFTTGHASNWHPLTWMSHMLDCQLFGQRAGAHHLVSAGFHVVNTLLLFLVLKSLTGALWRSALVAALFALHPLHVESVAWISERKDVLSTFFFVLTLLAYARYAEGRKQKAESRNQKAGNIQRPVTGGQSVSHDLPSSIFYLLSLLLFALGLMSKPMLVTLPFLLLLLDYWPLYRIGRSEHGSTRLQSVAPAGRSTSLWRLVAEKIPFLALSVISSYVTLIVQRKGGAVSTTISLGARLCNALVAYARYIGKMFWPQKLSVLYPHPGSWTAWEVAASGILLLAIFAVVIVFGRKRRYLVVGWLWFFGMLVPVIGLVQVGVQSMADRYTYVSLIGLFIMIVWGGAEIILAQSGGSLSPDRQSPRSKEIPSPQQRSDVAGILVARSWAPGIVLVLLVCGVVSWRQLHYWRDSEALFRHAVLVTDKNYLAYNNLGFFLSHKGKTAEALENYRKSLSINPAYEDALNNVGYVLALQKKHQEAIGYYEAALRVRPNQADVHNNLGNALSELGRIDEAMQQYELTLKLKPEHADAHNNLGIALAMRGRLDEAKKQFEEAIRSKPNDAGAHSNLGNALAAQHRLSEAIKEYQESLRLKPDDAQAHNNLGNALSEQSMLAEAVVHYEQALRLNPDNPEAHFNLGVTLARQGRREEAVEHYREALRLRPDYPQAQKQLSEATRPPGQP